MNESLVKEKRDTYHWTSVAFFIVVIACCLPLLYYPIVSYDFFWHLKAGEDIIASGAVPRFDIYTWYGIQENLPWYAHEWLSEVLFAQVYTIGGFALVALLQPMAFLIIICLLLNEHYDFKKRNNYVFFVFWVLLFSVFSRIFLIPRPQLFSYIIFSIALFAFRKFDKTGDWRHLIVIPLLFLLQINLHGGAYPSLVILSLLYGCSRLIEFEYGKISGKAWHKKHLMIFFGFIVAGLLACFINPRGYEMLLYPFTIVNDEVMMSAIMEWESINFHGITGKLYLGSIAMALLPLLLSKRKIDILDITLMGAFGAMGLIHTRLWIYFLMVSTPAVIKYSNDLVKQDKLSIKEMRRMKAIAGIFLIVFVMTTGWVVQYYIAEPTNLSAMPEDAIEHLEILRPDRLANDYGWGGYLIHELNDEAIYPFIDGRADVFAAYSFEDWLKIVRIDPSIDELITAYGFDSFLIQKESALSQYLRIHPEWIVYEEGDNWIIFVEG